MLNITPEEFFAPQGPMKTLFPNYTYRAAQVDMARSIYDRIKAAPDKRFPLAIEAPTGIGKSLAYLVGTVLAGAKVVVATANKALQSQLVTKDLPVIQQVFELYGQEFLFTQVMGKANYACKVRMADSEYVGGPVDNWLNESVTGNKYDIPANLQLKAEDIWRDIQVDEGCMGRKCALMDVCGMMRTKVKAAKSSVVVVNQHLLALDLVNQWIGIAVPPKFSNIWQGDVVVGTAPVVLVLDEAHEWEKILSSQTSVDIHRTLFDRYENPEVSAAATSLFEFLASYFLKAAGGNLKKISGFTKITLPESTRFPGSAQLVTALDAWANDTWPVGFVPESPADKKLQSRANNARDLAEKVELLTGDVPADMVRVVCIGSGKTMQSTATPLEERLSFEVIRWNVSSLSRKLWNGYRPGVTEQAATATGKVIADRSEEVDIEPNGSPFVTLPIFTSATLRSAGSYNRFLADVGFMNVADTLTLPNVFDYYRNSLLYVPTDMPSDVHSQQFQELAADRVFTLAKATQGRMFVLVTSFAKLRLIADQLEYMVRGTGMQILRQDKQAPKFMLDVFTEVEGHNQILLGTNTFWQGVDISGKALSQVVICGLPFPVPDDPVFAAKAAVLDRGGKRRSFMELSIPMMSFQLRQGYGRLLRRATDRGVVTILDQRITTERWAAPAARDLPNSRKVSATSAVFEFFGYLPTSADFV